MKKILAMILALAMALCAALAVTVLVVGAFAAGSMLNGAFNASSAAGIVIAALFLFLLLRPVGKKMAGLATG